MVALFGLLSFAGLFVFAILIIIRAIMKKHIIPSVIGFLVCLVVFAVCFAATPAKNKEQKTGRELEKETESIAQDNKKADFTEETPAPIGDKADETDAKEDNPVEEGSIAEETPEPDNEEAAKAVEYDALQSAFLTITDATTEEDVLALIDKYGLEYTSQHYNGTPKNTTYILAYEPGVARQRYADPGDSLEIAFSEEDGSLMFAEYFNHDAFMDAIYYHHGVHWNFRETGYYYYKPGDEYHSVQTPEEALANIL